MPPSKPGKPLSSVLRQDSTTQSKSLKSVLKDVREHNGHMDKTEQMRVAKTIKKLSTDPTKVTSKKLKKQALTALRDSGQLRERFHKNLGAAIHEMDMHAETLEKKSMSELRAMRPSELSAEEKKRLRMFKNRMRARAAQEREEIEGKFHAGDHNTTRFGLEQWQDASVSANSTQRRQSRYKLLDEDKKKKDSPSGSESKPPMVDMMI